MNQRTFDWRPNHDPQSRNYPIPTLATNRIRPTSLYWGNPNTILDQGQEGACVGFAWTNKLLALPIKTQIPTPNNFARNIYQQAQKIDEWPGENYSGTSVLAAAKIVKNLGYISEYRWAFTIEDILNALAHIGPVVLGIPWCSNMYKTTPQGQVTIGGTKVGGHAILATGYGPRTILINNQPIETLTIRWRNSWGPTYGINGDAHITTTDLQQLLKDGGEACIPIAKK